MQSIRWMPSLGGEGRFDDVRQRRREHRRTTRVDAEEMVAEFSEKNNELQATVSGEHEGV